MGVFSETTAKFPFPAHVLGRCLGPAKKEGNKMTQWVLKQNGHIVPRRTMRHLTPEEWAWETEIKKRSEFNDAVKARYGDWFSLPDKTLENPQDKDDTGDLTFDEVSPIIPEADIIDDQGRPLHPSLVADLLINAEVLFPQGENKRLAKVIKRSVNSDGKLIGNYNELPVLKNMCCIMFNYLMAPSRHTQKISSPRIY